MISSPLATKGTNNGVFVDGLPEREGLRRAFLFKNCVWASVRRACCHRRGAVDANPPRIAPR